MSSLIVHAEEEMKALCHGGDDGLEAAQVEIKDVLSKLKGAAEDVSGNASRIAAAVSGLRAKIESIRSEAHLLNQLVDSVAEALEHIECVRREIEAENPGVEMLLTNRAGLEQEYSARYTTEIERQLLRAALFGDPMPAAQAVVAGNDVELF